MLDRLPPRIAIRQDAMLKCHHVVIDGPKTVIEPISEEISEAEKLYDFELMMKGGRNQRLSGVKTRSNKSSSCPCPIG